MALKSLSDPMAWSGPDLLNDQKICTMHLSPADIEDIQDALQAFKNLGLDRDAISKQTFVLSSNLGQRLENCAEAIHNGNGFCVIRGLGASSSDYSAGDSTSIYLGLTSYIADQRGVQDKKGNVLSHITSSKLWTTPVNQRHGIHSTLPLPFHNDMGCDILALQCRESAELGGSTFLSSAAKVYNILLEQEPEVLETLTSPTWPVQISGSQVGHYLAPAFTLHNGRLMSCLDPNRFGTHPRCRHFDIPSLSDAQLHALEKVSEVARQVELRVNLEAGDMLLFNNWALLHRREAYEDGKTSTRHLVRLWLRNSDMGWEVPPEMSIPWAAAYGDGGARDTVGRQYLLEPRSDYEVPKYTAGSAAFVLDD